MRIKVLLIGDIVGKPGRAILANRLKKIREDNAIDFCVANGENVAGGSGLTALLVNKLFHYGVDVITSGDHFFRNPDVLSVADKQEKLLRPANYPPAASGHGFGIYTLASGVKIMVINLLGRIFLDPIDCPFLAVEKILAQKPEDVKIVLVDMHAEATSEKVAIGWFLDGRTSAVVGTHTHIQTADEMVLPKGLAYITDLGMTGPYYSVIGRKIEPVLRRLVTGMPSRFDVAQDDIRMCGAIVEIETDTGHAHNISRIVERWTPASAEDLGNDNE